MQDIIDNAKSLLAACKTEQEFAVIYHQVRERNKQFALSQHRRDIALRTDNAAPKAEQPVRNIS